MNIKAIIGKAEAVFDVAYLITATVLGAGMLHSASGSSPRLLAGIAALFLAFGDAFHLIPRIALVLTGKEKRLRRALGRGKAAASVTMTLYYLLLWEAGVLVSSLKVPGYLTILIMLLAVLRILLCLAPQNTWDVRFSSVRWALVRNVPFVLEGTMVAVLFIFVPDMQMMSLAIVLSFAFYIPVALYSSINPRLGALMLPKTLTYIWMLALCLSF